MAIIETGQTTEMRNQTQTKASDQTDSYSIAERDTDSVEKGGGKYTPNWKKYHGQYRAIPELRAVINKLASWTFGRGIKANKENEAKLKKIKGNGKDSSRLVLKNQWRTALICGDSFAHIIKESGNLKPLNPGHITIQWNEEGIITGYKHKDRKQPFDVEEIYHLSYERIADENHGIPFPEALEDLIKARNEGLEDLRILYHRNIKPIMFFEAETNDQTKLNSITATIDDAYKKSENIVISAGQIKEIKRSGTPHFSTLDSLPYIKFLVRLFVTSCGMPEVIMGWGESTTEASANIIYLAYQQEIEDMQLYNQEMVELQLDIKINLEFPASLEMKVQDNNQKRGDGTTTQPNKDG